MSEMRLPALSLLACVAVSIPLLSLNAVFYVDWINHLWTIQYYGEFFKVNLLFPQTLNTQTEVGLVVPLFYSEKFYAISGFISSQFGAPVTIRILVILVLVIAAFELLRCLSRLGVPNSLNLALVVAMTWDVYVITNLYNRSALTEFFAIKLLVACISSSLIVVVDVNRASLGESVRPGLYFTLAAAFHPITALFGGIFIFLLISPFVTTRKTAIILGISLISSLIVLLPWLYVSVSFVKDTLYAKAGVLANGFHPDSLDAIWSRLSIIPLDWRSVLKGLDVSTPYLDAQISIPLLLLASFMAVVAWQTRADLGSKASRSLLAVLIVSMVALGISLSVSVAPHWSAWFGGLFDIMQFPYRLTAYATLAILAAAIALAGLIDWEWARFSRAWSASSVVIAISLTLATVNLVQKLVHSAAIQKPASAETTKLYGKLVGIPVRANGHWAPASARLSDHLADLPGSYYGDIWYRVTRGFALPSPNEPAPITRLNLTVGSSAGTFGRVLPASLELHDRSLVVTNIQPFPWNRIIVNGSLVPRAEVIASPVAATAERREVVLQALHLEPGRHDIRYAFRPPLIWLILYALSWIVLVPWICIVILSATPLGGHPRVRQAYSRFFRPFH